MKYSSTMAKRAEQPQMNMFLLIGMITRLTAIVRGFIHTPVSPNRTKPTTMIQLPLRKAGRAKMSMHRMRCGSVAKGARGRYW
jgi:hypothetical protein